MNGRLFVYIFAGFTVVFGIGLYYAQVYAKYEATDGQATVLAGDMERPVAEYIGIDSVTSPLKLRGCFVIAPETWADLPVAEAPTPLSAPRWFQCFDYEQITADVESGLAIVYVAGVEERGAADRLVAVYPDGRAFEWRQLNAKYLE